MTQKHTSITPQVNGVRSPASVARVGAEINLVKPGTKTNQSYDSLSDLKLTFTPYAFAKIMYMANAVDIEISGMAITTSSDPLLVTDFLLIKQEGTEASTEFDMDHYEEVMFALCDPSGETKLQPTQCQRIWVHTHPSFSPTPSLTDVKTFSDGWGVCDWSVMCIVTQEGEMFAQLNIKSSAENVTGKHIRHKLETGVSYLHPFPETDHEAWQEELDTLVTRARISTAPRFPSLFTNDCRSRGDGIEFSRKTDYRSVSGWGNTFGIGDSDWDDWDDWEPPKFSELDDYYSGRRANFSNTSVDHKKNIGFTPPIPTLKLHETDLLYPLPLKMAETLLSEAITHGDLSQDMVESLADLGVQVGSSDASITDEVEFEYDCPVDNLAYSMPSDELTFSTRDPSKLDADIFSELQEAERDLIPITASRFFGQPDACLDAYNKYANHLIPWKCCNGETIAVSEHEYDTLSDIEAGRTGYNEDNSFYADGVDDLESEEVSSSETSPSGDALLDGNIPDELLSLCDAFDFHRQAVLDSLDPTSGAVNAIAVENRFSNLQEGADTGDWSTECRSAANVFRRNGYALDASTAEMIDIIERAQRSTVYGQRSEVQPDTEEVNEAILSSDGGSDDES